MLFVRSRVNCSSRINPQFHRLKTEVNYDRPTCAWQRGTYLMRPGFFQRSGIWRPGRSWFSCQVYHNHVAGLTLVTGRNDPATLKSSIDRLLTDPQGRSGFQAGRTPPRGPVRNMVLRTTRDSECSDPAHLLRPRDGLIGLVQLCNSAAAILPSSYRHRGISSPIAAQAEQCFSPTADPLAGLTSIVLITVRARTEPSARPVYVPGRGWRQVPLLLPGIDPGTWIMSTSKEDRVPWVSPSIFRDNGLPIFWPRGSRQAGPRSLKLG